MGSREYETDDLEDEVVFIDNEEEQLQTPEVPQESSDVQPTSVPQPQAPYHSILQNRLEETIKKTQGAPPKGKRVSVIVPSVDRRGR